MKSQHKTKVAMSSMKPVTDFSVKINNLTNDVGTRIGMEKLTLKG
jgi:hypothetical protein